MIDVSVVILGDRSEAGPSDHYVTDVMIAPNATVEGRPSVIFRVLLPDATTVTIETSAKIVRALGSIIDGRFPDLMG